MPNMGAKGRRNEYRTIAWLKAQGYETMRAAGSKGLWDVHAWNARGSLYIQVKSNEWPGAAELRRMSESALPPGAKGVIHRWNDGARAPLFMTILCQGVLPGIAGGPQ